jgi:hypothetical protein
MSGIKQLNGKNGKVQMKLYGGERIYSIGDTAQLIFLAQNAKTFQDWVRLGRYLHRATKAQQTRKPEYR